MMKLFGTDGVRGVAGEELTEELARRSARAAAELAPPDRPQVLIVRDTRESGPVLERALAEGIAAAGGDVFLGGVLPTPAASILVRRLGLDLAAVVSASHNPWRDNGIKFFGPPGRSSTPPPRRRSKPGSPSSAPAASRGVAAAAGAIRELEGGLDDYLRELVVELPARPLRAQRGRRLRERRHPRGGAGDLPPPRRRGRGDRRASPTAATSTRAAARPTPRRSPRASPPRRRRASASPSMATETGWSPSTATATSATATS